MHSYHKLIPRSPKSYLHPTTPRNPHYIPHNQQEKCFLFYQIVSRLALRRQIHRTFLTYNRSVIVVELNSGVWLGTEKLLDDNELTEV